MASECITGKFIYRTPAAAEKGARKTRSGLGLHWYACKFCRQYHLTKQAPRTATEQPPSAAKLRRQLANAAAQIKATEKRLTAAQREWFAELDAIRLMTDRIMEGRTR